MMSEWIRNLVGGASNWTFLPEGEKEEAQSGIVNWANQPQSYLKLSVWNDLSLMIVLSRVTISLTASIIFYLPMIALTSLPRTVAYNKHSLLSS